MLKSRSTDRAEHVVGGRYRLEGSLGRGGMAAVYRAHDLKADKKVALKRCWASDKRKAVKRRALLEREFHTLAHLSHPRIIEVYDYGVDDDGPFYTMELLDGADLDKNTRLPWEQACALLRDIASSLAILHSRGLIHRDVSLRNVRCTANGRAKLFDFGAMMSAGVATDIVGTPPFMAPEVLQMQRLDERADLYSLGAVGYHMLAGRHAFPARRVSDLRDAWRSRPTPPAKLFAEVPAALSDLIMQLLSLDRNARPVSASEVMERLCSIAELPKEELPEISRAYLATPALVGRDKALVSVRNRMLSLVRGDGSVIFIDGLAGMGRSRLVDACVFDGKLLGATVVRASANDSNSGDWGVARAIGAQLCELLPKEVAYAARLSKHVLVHIIEEIGRNDPRSPSGSISSTLPEHSLILRELRDLVLTLASEKRVLIAVDDVDRIDAPSASFLAALADKCDRKSLLLVVSGEPAGSTPQTAPLSLLRSLGHVVPLEPFSAEQTEALLRSLFGDVANLQLCAGRIHALAQGNPLASMDLAQHLVTRGLARYEAGSWRLPSQLDEHDLPASLAESLSRRLHALSDDARELAEAMCVTDGHALMPATFCTLSTHRDIKRVFSGFEELVAARIAVASSDAYRFSQRGFIATLRASTSEERCRQLHAAFADVLAERGSDVLQCAYHLLHGGREAHAIELMCRVTGLDKLPGLSVLEDSVAYAERDPALPTRMLQQMRTALLHKASLHLAIDSFHRCLPSVLAQLERDSGLELYMQLTDVPADQRLGLALAQQQQRYLATPENERVFGVSDGIRELARTVSATCSMAQSMFDMELLESMPSLEPLYPLSPALSLVSLLRQACADWIAGRGRGSKQRYQEILDRIQQDDRAGLDPSQHARVWFGVQYALGLIEASLGIERVEERARELESDRAMRVNGWRLRGLLHACQGNAEAARKCSRRAELLQLQDGSETQYLGTTAGFDLRAFAMAEDLLGVKTSVEALAVLAEKYPGWRAMHLLGQISYRELQGDLSGALELLKPGFELCKPGRHLLYGLLATAHVRLLRKLNQVEASLDHGWRYVAICDAEELSTPAPMLRAELVLSLTRAGNFPLAVEIADELIRNAEALGSSGMAVGVFFETRAWVAIAMKDQAKFDYYSRACAREYKKGRSAALSAKFARLLEAAGQQGLMDIGLLTDQTTLFELEPESEYNTIASRIIECVDGPDRARCALTLLLQSTDTYLGYLFGAEPGKLLPLAGFPELNADPELERWLLRWVSAEHDLAVLQPSSVVTGSLSEPPTAAITTGDNTCTVEAPEFGSPTVPDVYTDPEGRRFRAVMLHGATATGRTIAAVFACEVTVRGRARPANELLSHIASQLLSNGDVQGMPI